MYRCLHSGVSAYPEYPPKLADVSFPRIPVGSADELEKALKEQVTAAASDGKAALALSGGIDSAILAKFMPKGSVAYTFRCVVPGKQVVDESIRASKYAEECGLKHEITDITFDEALSVCDTLMKHKGAPIHSIEAQIYLASLRAKKDGFKRFIFGETADAVYGGLDGLLGEDRTTGEFIERFSFVAPYKVMYDPAPDYSPFYDIEKDGHIDAHDFINKYFFRESLGSYLNACETAGIEFIAPYSRTKMSVPIDYEKIRSGNSKYFVREVFSKLYPGWETPKKTPMPRPVSEWLGSWSGPVRSEFIPHCTDGMTGDMKWMVFILERFLNLMEK
ncbi:MAG: asparagine synthase C-terminal domain-containing protein [Clostridiales bacterium]|nr:asparagine synthase C-terminal domain-containing protein [Clostridiales bacterium]